MKYLLTLIFGSLAVSAFADIMVNNNCEAGNVVIQQVSNGASCMAPNNNASLTGLAPKGMSSHVANPSSSYCVYLYTPSSGLGAKACKVSGTGNVSFNPGTGGKAAGCSCSA